uniref:DUF2934 domain-containing protein n=1 Tax=viral metagenome TaxID=1070528 RepID=A0A6M3IY75_9ZZZZ
MDKDTREDEIRRFAFHVWKTRVEKGDPRANDATENWFIAEHAVCVSCKEMDGIQRLGLGKK